jgi:hypothetical protein
MIYDVFAKYGYWLWEAFSYMVTVRHHNLVSTQGTKLEISRPRSALVFQVHDQSHRAPENT